jgi:integrative and conjugative element protein (TIGR02256 family)
MYLATAANYSQRVRIAHNVLDHTVQFRQLNWRAPEAGGQLFGTVAGEEVRITRATGPHAGDTRSRYAYRSNPSAAQRCIDEYGQMGLLYLGEWHTHPETAPNASTTDVEAMMRLRAASQTRVSTLLMLIQGRAQGVDGLALYSFDDEGVARWQIAQGVHREGASMP